MQFTITVSFSDSKKNHKTVRTLNQQRDQMSSKSLELTLLIAETTSSDDIGLMGGDIGFQAQYNSDPVIDVATPDHALTHLDPEVDDGT